MHIGAKWAQLARWHADQTAIIDDKGRWSYRQFVSRINQFGHAMRGLGLAAGDRVALMVPDIREYLEADYGTMSAGLVRVPLDPRLTRNELIALMRHAGVRALVSHVSFAGKVEGLTDEVESLDHIIAVGGPLRDALAYEAVLERASDRVLPEGDENDLAALNFSGGTTGAPKATMLRHRNLMAVAQNTIHGFEIDADAIFLNVRPLWPIAQVIMMSYLMAGATVVLGGRFDAEGFAAQVQRTGATRTSLVPTQLVRFVEHVEAGDARLERLEAIHVGGSRIPPTVFEQALNAIGPKIGVLYGLTEAPVTCYMPPRQLDCAPSERERLIHAVGRELFGYQVRISDSTDGSGDAASGEVLIRGANVMAGYWGNETASQNALRNGWLHTGDIGRFDENGNLFIVGRLKDVIRSGSSTIVPKEVEDVIVRHPAVNEVAVLGVPDVEWGEAVTAFVVLKPGCIASEAELQEHCRAHLASYKKPRTVRFVASLPRSHYGKVLQAQLIAQAGG
ncbi:AMP-binding protein [Microbacteriaceae bacterium K1510]|nr:AMP-binding protein [Microbacteriaceae bacterium K1510]